MYIDGAEVQPSCNTYHIVKEDLDVRITLLSLNTRR